GGGAALRIIGPPGRCGSSSRRNPGQRRTEATPSAKTDSSPGQASLKGASMPPATHAAPPVGTPSGPESSGSWTTTSATAPERASAHAQASPITEPPTTATRSYSCRGGEELIPGEPRRPGIA